jgi:hypothetical protein
VGARRRDAPFNSHPHGRIRDASRNANCGRQILIEASFVNRILTSVWFDLYLQ